MALNNEIISLLKKEKCSIVDFADLRSLPKETRQNFDYGIVLALSYSKDAINDNKNGLPQKYYEQFKEMNIRLNELATLTAKYLTDKGHKALGKVQSTVVQDEDLRTVLPHKTVATLAGIGWIGKCALLVTDEVGSALRITVVLTDAPLDCGTPITKSKCPADCNICRSVCPGKAPLGGLWSVDTDRSEFFDAKACREGARNRAKATLGVDETVCGLCIANCPFTIQGLERVNHAIRRRGFRLVAG